MNTIEVLEQEILKLILSFNDATGRQVKEVSIYQAGTYIRGNDAYAVKALVEDN